MQLQQCGKNVVIIENHPADSRVNICEDGICQTLTSRMGTGGGNIPLIMEVWEKDGKRNRLPG